MALGAHKVRFTSKDRKGTLGIRRAQGTVDSTLILRVSNTGSRSTFDSCHDSCRLICFIPYIPPQSLLLFVLYH